MYILQADKSQRTSKDKLVNHMGSKGKALFKRCGHKDKPFSNFVVKQKLTSQISHSLLLFTWCIASYLKDSPDGDLTVCHHDKGRASSPELDSRGWELEKWRGKGCSSHPLLKRPWSLIFALIQLMEFGVLPCQHTCTPCPPWMMPVMDT